VILVLMGVSGCGKTTVGARLAEELGWEFIDGDDHHPPENRQKMGRVRPSRRRIGRRGLRGSSL